METKPIKEYILEKYKQQLVQDQGFGVNRITDNQTSSCCIVLCEKLGPHLFEIKKGIAVVKEGEGEDCFNNGDYMVMNPAKVIFMFE